MFGWIKRLLVRRNKKEDKVVESIEDKIRRLMKNGTLTKLSLSKNKIDAEVAKVLAEVLGKNDTLTELNLNANEIGPEGTMALAKALGKNDSLTSIYLDYDGVNGAVQKQFNSLPRVIAGDLKVLYF